MALSRTFPQADPLLLRTDMSNPDDDTDVPSAFDDDASMERTPSPTPENWLRSKIKEGAVSLKYINTHDQLADLY